MATQMMTYRQAAELLQLPIGTVYAMVSHHRIPHVRLGPRLVRFSRDEITKWLEVRRVGVSPLPNVGKR
jgi:excisionase family DNA binding protein